MFEASVIEPKDASHQITCDDCQISYPREHYGILFERKKIIYFDFLFPKTSYLSCLCHDCLFKNLKNITNGETAKVIIYNGEKKIECDFF